MGENKIAGTVITGNATQRNADGGSNSIEGGQAGSIEQITSRKEQVSFLGMQASGKLAVVAGVILLVAYFLYLIVK